MENSKQTLPAAALKILQARHPAPFEYLGRHIQQQGTHRISVIRTILPHAIDASLCEPPLAMQRLNDTPIFEIEVTAETLPDHYIIEWHDSEGKLHRSYDPYSFDAQLTDRDLKLFIEGRLHRAAQVLGAHITAVDGIEGVLFSTWAPNAERISIVGDFNRWDNRCHVMRARGASGVWELFIPDIQAGTRYHFETRNHHSGEVQQRADPYARRLDTASNDNALVAADSAYRWNDQQWLQHRGSHDRQHTPVSIYQVHLASWKHADGETLLKYRELAEQLVEYVRELGFTHIELVSMHPASNTGNYFTPDNRHGDTDDFSYFIDYCHQHRIGVILEWNVDHLSSEDPLKQFDGGALYEQGTDNSTIFDYSRNGVRNLLISSALFWLDAFHLDGLKLSTSTAMLYPEDRQNSDALSLLREINELVYQSSPGAIMIVEENTAWSMVTHPAALGGLGFSLKWNNSWVHDTLKFFAHETTQRPHHHETLIFSQQYAFSEHFVLPLSHQNRSLDNRALINRMPGEKTQRFANLRLLYSYMFTHPGNKLLFMGNEFGINSEWDPQSSLPWDVADRPLHGGLSRMVADLNSLYRNTLPLHHDDFDKRGFEWIDCHDSTQSLLVFRRNSESETVIVALNFSAIARQCYRIGVPYDTTYKELFNSDAYQYGGKDRLNSGGMRAETLPWMKQPCSVTITLPPLSAVILKPLHSAITATIAR